MTEEVNTFGRVSKWFQEMLDSSMVREMAQTQLLEVKINEHLASPELEKMRTAQSYYMNKTAIQEKKAQLSWKNNAKLEHGLFKKLVSQKVNYLLSLEPSVTVDDDEEGQKILNGVFDKDFFKVIKSLGKEVIVKGIAYSIVYYNEDGDLNLFKVPTEQIIPFWKDERRLQLDAFIRFYQNVVYVKGMRTEETVVEYWDEHGITYYLLVAGRLKEHPHMPATAHHQFIDEKGKTVPVNWERIPLIAWRYNEEEDSLLTQVKSLIDNLEMQSSVNADMLADLPKLIYVIKNYGGTELEEFIPNLEKFYVVNLEDNGDLTTLQAEPNTAGVEAELIRTRKAIYEAGSGIDTQDDNLGNASGVALKFRYSDLDLDCNDLENEFQQSIEQFLWFIKHHAQNNFSHDLDLSTFKYVFNRDIIINDSEAIQNAIGSRGILDDKTIRENHPWYTAEVEDRLEKQQEKDREVYGHNSAFPNQLRDRIRDKADRGQIDEQEE